MRNELPLVDNALDGLWEEFGITQERATELRIIASDHLKVDELKDKLYSNEPINHLDVPNTANIAIMLWNDNQITDMELLYLVHQLGKAGVYSAMHKARFS